MGKIRTRIIGNEEIEEKQKLEQKKRSEEKKLEKKEKKSEEIVETTSPKAEEKEQTSEKKEKKSKKNNQKSTKTKARGKKYTEALKKVDAKKQYELHEAVELLKKIAFAKFEESVELHLNVLSDGLRGEIELPYSTGKTVRVAIVSDAVLEEIESGTVNFDILISHPSFMPKLAKYARTLGPKGLMPNPKAGTISTNPEEAAKKFEKGMLRWKAESKFPLIHQLIAKLPHDTKNIVENASAFIKAVGISNIKAAYIKSTMSPSLRIKLDTV